MNRTLAKTSDKLELKQSVLEMRKKGFTDCAIVKFENDSGETYYIPYFLWHQFEMFDMSEFERNSYKEQESFYLCLKYDEDIDGVVNTIMKYFK